MNLFLISLLIISIAPGLAMGANQRSTLPNEFFSDGKSLFLFSVFSIVRYLPISRSPPNFSIFLLSADEALFQGKGC